jgi:hypothetical protein
VVTELEAGLEQVGEGFVNRGQAHLSICHPKPNAPGEVLFTVFFSIALSSSLTRGGKGLRGRGGSPGREWGIGSHSLAKKCVPNASDIPP